MNHLSPRISLWIAILGAALSLPLSSGWGQVNTPPDGFGILPDEVGVHYGPANSVPITVAGANLLDAAPDGEFVKAATGQVLWALRHTPASSSTPAPGPLDEVDLHRRDSAGQWIYETTLQAPLAAGATSEFGAAVVASGNRLFIGAPGAVSSSSVAGGVVYVYEFDGATLTSVQTLELADGVAGDRFGAALAVEGGRLLVGAPGRDKVDGGSTVANAGAVYFHELSGTWSMVRTAWSNQPQAGAQFGFSVGLSGRRFAVGAPFEDGEYVVGGTPTVLSDAGAVYLGRWDAPSGLLAYKNLFSTYAPVQAAMSGITGSHFGWSVAVDDHMRVAVSMPDSSWTSMDNMAGWDAGLVMVMHWNGEMSPDEAFVRTSFSHAELPAGARFGEHVETAAGNVDFGIRTAQRVNSAPVHYYALEAVQAQPGALVGSVESPFRVGDLVATDAEDLALTMDIPASNNPYGVHFEISPTGELRAKSSLANLLDGIYPLELTVTDSGSSAISRLFQMEVTGAVADVDRDKMGDLWETAHGLDPLIDDSALDPDGDGLNNAGEFFHGTDPNDADSDNDGSNDLVEFATANGLLPQSLTVSFARSTSVTLTWQDNCAFESGFIVQKSEDGGTTWSSYTTVAPNVTFAGVRGLNPATTYKFRVVAGSAYGNVASSVVTGATSSERPVGLGYGSTIAIKDDGSLWRWGGWNGPYYRPVQFLQPSFKALASGYDHFLAVKDNGTVWAWGQNANGQLGIGNTESQSNAVEVDGLTDIVAVSAGYQHTLALKADGTVLSWGSNAYGQLGNGGGNDMSVPTTVAGLIDIVAVSAGYYFSTALKADGTVWIWGRNEFGQLGNNSTTGSAVPVQILGLSGVVKVSAGEEYCLALKADRTIWSWGRGNVGQLGAGNYSDSWGPVQVEGAMNMVDIAAGRRHSLAVKSDGTAWTWGWGDAYSLRTINHSPVYPVQVPGITDAVSIYAGYKHSAIVRPNGELWTWGSNWDDQLGKYGGIENVRPAVVLGVSNVADIGLGFSTLALKKDGTVMSWGAYNGLGNGDDYHSAIPATVPGLTEVKQVAAGFNHGLALKTDGTVYSWGHNFGGQLGNGPKDFGATPDVVGGLPVIKAISGGENFSLGLADDGHVWSWGYNAQGQLCDGTLINRPTAVLAQGLSNVIQISAGRQHALALLSDGTVRAWGWNAYGQLGNNSSTDSKAPVEVQGLDRVIAVSAGADHSLALRDDGTVWAWGQNSGGQLGIDAVTSAAIPTQVIGLENIVAISGGVDGSLALTANGKVWGWGQTQWGQLGFWWTGAIPLTEISGLEGVKKIFAGQSTNVAVRADGSIVSWGGSWHGQTGIGLIQMDTTPGPVEGFDFARVAPDVQITTPTNGTNTPLGQPTTVTATFTPGDGDPQSVSFYHYGVLLGTDDTAPFQYTLNPSSWGDYPISAIGVDDLGVKSARSTEVVLTVSYSSDFDSDGLPDWWEYGHHGVITHGSSDDVDNDGLTEAGEYFYGTLPTLSDSDDDGLGDFEEFVADHPLAPQSPSVVSVRSGSVTLTWQDTCSYETGFTVQVSADGGSTWSDAVHVAADVTTTGVRGLSPSTAYMFRVLAGSEYGAGASVAVSQSTIAERSVAAGQWQMHAIKEDGTLWSWGSDWQDAKYRPVQIAGSGYAKAAFAQTHSLTLKNDGTVWSWGYNDRGQLGLGDSANRSVPTLVSAMTDVSAVATGAQHSVILKSDGTVWTWGANSFGQLGVGNYLDSQIPLQVTALDDIIAVSAGHTHSLALRADGTVWAWGNGEFGRLGNNGTTNSNVAVQVQDLSDIVKISAGGEHSMALGKDGSIWTWGKGDAAQLGDGNTSHSSVPLKIQGLQDMVDIAAGSWHSMALSSDGHVWGWGWSRAYVFSNLGGPEPFIPRMVNGIENASAVFAGHEHSAVAMPDGALWTWGGNWYGQLGRYGSLKVTSPAVLLGLNNAKDVSVRFGGLVLNRDGSVSSWGQHWTLGNGGQSHVAEPGTVAGLADVRAIASGMNHALALTNTGKVYAWGVNSHGALGNNTTSNSLVPVEVSGLTDVVSVSGGEIFSVAVRSDGTAWTWGYNSVGQLGDNTPIMRVVPAAVPGLSGVSGVSAGNLHCLALKQNGTVVSWGGNEVGQLGNNSTAASSSPVPVANLTNVIQISAGYDHSLALKADGTVWAWGSGGDGRLGNNSTSNELVPVQVQGLSGVVAVAAGLHHSIALKSDGTVWGWGNGIGGQLGSGGMNGHLLPAQVVDLENVVKVSAGSGFTTVVREDGSVVSLGGTWLANVGNGLMYMNSTPGPVEGFHFARGASVVEVAIPPAGSTFPIGRTVKIRASLSPTDELPMSVSFYHYGVLLGTDYSAPFEHEFAPETWGNYPISVIATGTSGVSSARSEAVEFRFERDIDSDNDELPDWWEAAYFQSLNQDGSGDDDQDGLSNLEEMQSGTNPLETDSDRDGMPDDWEIANGLDPIFDDSDGNSDGDDLFNGEEFLNGLSPTDGLDRLIWKTYSRSKSGSAYPSGFAVFDYSSETRYRKKTFSGSAVADVTWNQERDTEEPWHGIHRYHYEGVYTRDFEHTVDWTQSIRNPIITSRLEIPPGSSNLDEHYSAQYYDLQSIDSEYQNSETSPPWFSNGTIDYELELNGSYEGPYEGTYSFAATGNDLYEWTTQSSIGGNDQGSSSTQVSRQASFFDVYSPTFDFHGWSYYPDYQVGIENVGPLIKVLSTTITADAESTQDVAITGSIEKQTELSEEITPSQVKAAARDDIDGVEWTEWQYSYGFSAWADYILFQTDNYCSVAGTATEYYVKFEHESGQQLTGIKPRTQRWFETYTPERGEPVQVEREATLIAGQASNVFVLDPMARSDSQSGGMLLQYQGLLVFMSEGENNILVNDGDEDSDALPGFADGFNRYPALAFDDVSSGAPSNILTIAPYGYVLNAEDSVTISYAASPPAAIQREGVKLQVPSSQGKLRLWKKGLTSQRNGSSVLAGGDYVAPGTYTLAQLGWTSNSESVQLFAEGINPSDYEGDAGVSVTFQPSNSNAGGPEFGTVPLIVSRLEIWGRGYGETENDEPTQFGDFIYSYLFEESEHTNTTSDKLLMPGSWVIHTVRVHDPRTWELDHINIGGIKLQLYASESGYLESEPFIVSDLSENVPPGVVRIPASRDGVLDFQFNGKGKKKVPGTKYTPDELDDLVQEELNSVVDALESAAWPENEVDFHPANDPSGGFGSRVHANMSQSARLQAVDGWIHDVWVLRSTGEVIDIGSKNLDGISSELVQQIDLVHIGRGNQLALGDVLSTKAVRIYDIKTSLRGARISTDQRARLHAALGATEENGKLVVGINARRHYSHGIGWIDHPRYKLKAYINKGTAGKFMGFIAGIFAVYSVWDFVESGRAEEKLEIVISNLQHHHAVSEGSGDDNELAATQNMIALNLNEIMNEIGANEGWGAILVYSLTLKIANDPSLIQYITQIRED